VTFDFGQTLAEIDTELLRRRLAERALETDVRSLDEAVPTAWRRYDEEIARGVGGHPWKLLMRTLLETAHVDGDIEGAVDWLWEQQLTVNLWRRPIDGVIDVVDALRRTGVTVGVISNSEGKLAELADELGWGERFAVISDSGLLGVEKPDRRIFEITAGALSVALEHIIHIGDSWQADVLGALDAGCRAIWFGGAAGAPQPPSFESDRVQIAWNAGELRAALAAWGVNVGGG
jgi:putative hydrolase of the HAD superfamily